MKNIKTSVFIVFIIVISTFSSYFIYNYFNDKVTIDNYNNNSNIPRIDITGNIDNMKTKSDIRKVSITYKSNNLNFNSYATLKLQGSTSLDYKKKNYTINLFSDKNYESKKNIDFGFGSKQSKYVLKANWVDKTHSRNIVTAKLASEIQDKYNLFNDTPNNGLIDGFPVEIYENNKFLGLYTLNIPKDSWMFSMDENNENHIVLGSNGWGDTNLFKEESNFDKEGILWEVEVGNNNQQSFDKLNRLIKFVNTTSDKEFKNDFSKYFNLDSTINYFIMLEFAQLEDNVGNNLLLVTYDGNIWYPTLYDLDGSWGINYEGTNKMVYNINTNTEDNKLFERLLKNFRCSYSKRWFVYRIS